MWMTNPNLSTYLLTIFCINIYGHAIQAQTYEYDIVVYGGTASGVIAAVSAAREGMQVALLETHSGHLGGMVSGGLSITDIGNKSVIGGYVKEVFLRVGKYYNLNDVNWHTEPHIAEKVFNDMVNEANVDVFLKHRLKEQGGVLKDGRRITTITMENGVSFSAKVFIDSSYEGDLMAFAGASFVFGREPQTQYGEAHAGIRKVGAPYLSAYDDNGKLLPGVLASSPGPVGSGDKKTQAYNFRYGV